MPTGSAHQQIGYLWPALAEFRLHADHQVKQLFALDYLRGCLAAHPRLDYGLHVGYVDSVAGDLFAIHIHQEAGLPQFADHRQLRKPRDALQRLLDLDSGILQNAQVRAKDLDGQRAL